MLSRLWAASLKESVFVPTHVEIWTQHDSPLPWKLINLPNSPPSSAPWGEKTAHLDSSPAGPERWQVMRVVWCLEPLKRSSLAVQTVGWAGRAAVTCSPFFTLILAGGHRSSLNSWTGSEGEHKGRKMPASGPARPGSGLNVLLPILSPRRTPSQHSSHPAALLHSNRTTYDLPH